MYARKEFKLVEKERQVAASICTQRRRGSGESREMLTPGGPGSDWRDAHTQGQESPPPPFHSLEEFNSRRPRRRVVIGNLSGASCRRGSYTYILWGVTKRCRLSWITNSAFVYDLKWGGGGGCGGLSQWVQICTWSPNKLGISTVTPYLTYDPFHPPAVSPTHV